MVDSDFELYDYKWQGEKCIKTDTKFAKNNATGDCELAFRQIKEAYHGKRTFRDIEINQLSLFYREQIRKTWKLEFIIIFQKYLVPGMLHM